MKRVQPQYVVYLLLCADSTLYTGITTDVERRFLEHKTGKGGYYTRAHPPVKILYVEAQPNRSLASKREAEVKKLSRQEKLTLVRTSSYRSPRLRPSKK